MKDFLNKTEFSFEDIEDIIKRLREPDGCEWDKAQTHESIRANLIEEAYELVDAIDNKDVPNMREETGDVLLQAVFHAVLAEESGEYTLQEVLNELGKKLVTRHTHIFGADKAHDAAEALYFWNKAKSVEKQAFTPSEKMARVPKGLPQLMYADKVSKAARKVGFDWDTAEECLDKVHEELGEFAEAAPSEREEEAGDLLFAVVNYLRKSGIEPETALRRANAKFVRRFTSMESKIFEQGKALSDCTLDEMENAWQQVKKDEKKD